MTLARRALGRPAATAALLAALAVGHALPAHAEQLPAAEAPAAPAAPAADAAPGAEVQDAPETAPQAMTVRVKLEHATRPDAPVADVVVVVQADRVRGPFEPPPEKALYEVAGTTDAQGQAEIALPGNVLTEGLRVKALARFDGMTFQSAPMTPSPTTQIGVKVYDRGVDTGTIRITTLRTMVQPWEDYLVFTQSWTLGTSGKEALDMSALPDPDMERGLPLVLPVKAEGIQTGGDGQVEVVNNIVFWKGVLKPGEPSTVQVRFSMSAKSPEFTYEQTLDYPADTLEILAPLRTEFRKIPRLNKLELAAPGFTVASDGTAVGLAPDAEVLVAHGAKLERGQALRFQLRGLPFEPPLGPWVTLGLGLVAAFGILFMARKEGALRKSATFRQMTLDALEAERRTLMQQLAEIERSYREGQMEELDYQGEESLLRERISLLLKKIDDLCQGSAPRAA